MRLAGAIVVVAISTGLVGCSYGRLPAAPTPSESPAALPPAPAVAAEQWKLTSTLKSVEGPEACISIFAKDIGQPSDFRMEIQRSGGHSIQLAYDIGNPEVNEKYSGTVVAAEFSATGAVNSGAMMCGGARYDFTTDGQVAGRFVGDGRSLTAEETYALRFTSGEAITFHYEWKASRQ